MRMRNIKIAQKAPTLTLLVVIATFLSLTICSESAAQSQFKVMWWNRIDSYYTKTFTRFAPGSKSVYLTVDTIVYNGAWLCYKVSKVFQYSEDNGALLSESDSTKTIVDFDISRKGNMYVTAQHEEGVKIWDAKTHKVLDEIKEPLNNDIDYYHAIISPDEKYVVTLQFAVSQDRKGYQYLLRVYDIVARKTIKTIPAIKGFELRYSNDGKTFALSGDTSTVNNAISPGLSRLILYDAASWEQIASFAYNGSNDAGYRKLIYSPTSNRIAAITNKSHIIIDVKTREQNVYETNYEYHGGKSLLFLPGNNYLVCQYVYDEKYYKDVWNASEYYDNKYIGSTIGDYEHLISNNLNSNEDYRILSHGAYEYYSNALILSALAPASVAEEIHKSVLINYTNGNLLISCSGIQNETAKVAIYDVIGNEVYSDYIELNDNSLNRINLKLDNGLYIYRIFGCKQEFAGKIVVTK